MPPALSIGSAYVRSPTAAEGAVQANEVLNDEAFARGQFVLQAEQRPLCIEDVLEVRQAAQVLRGHQGHSVIGRRHRLALARIEILEERGLRPHAVHGAGVYGGRPS